MTQYIDFQMSVNEGATYAPQNNGLGDWWLKLLCKIRNYGY